MILYLKYTYASIFFLDKFIITIKDVIDLKKVIYIFCYKTFV